MYTSTQVRTLYVYLRGCSPLASPFLPPMCEVQEQNLELTAFWEGRGVQLELLPPPPFHWLGVGIISAAVNLEKYAETF